MEISNATQLQIMFAAISTPLTLVIVSYLKSCAWSDKVKTLLSFLVALTLGTISVFLSKGKITLEDWAETIPVIYTASHLIYITWFKKLPFNKWLEQKEVL